MIRPAKEWRENHVGFLFVAVAFLAMAVFQAPEILTGHFRWGEESSYFIATRVEAARLMKEGELPLFTDRYFAGHPIYSAAYGAMLYPPNLLYLVLREQSANVLKTFHIFLGALGMFVYLRQRRLTPTAAFLGALVFSTSTFLINHMDHVPFHESAALAPWGAWLALRLMRSPSPTRAALLATFVALHFSIGYAQTNLMTLGWFGIEWLTAFRPRRRWLWGTLWMLAAGILGFGIMAIQILPTTEHAAQSIRTMVSLDYWYWDSLPPSHLILFFHPLSLGSLIPGWRGHQHAVEVHGTLMPMGWALAFVPYLLLGRLRRHPLFRFSLFLAGGILLALVLAMGRFIPGYHLLFEVPGFNMFRAPARWIFLICVFGSILAAIGVQLLLRLNKWRAALAYLCAYAALALICIGGWYLATLGRDRPRLSLFEMSDYPVMTQILSEWRLPQLGGALDHYGLHILIPLIGAIPIAFLRERPRWMCAALLFLTCFQWTIFAHHFHFRSTDISRMFHPEKNPVISQFPPDEIIERAFLITSSGMFTDLSLPPNFNVYMSLPTLNGFSALQSIRLHLALRLGMNGVSWTEEEYLRNVTPLHHMGVSHLIVEAERMPPERRALLDEGISSLYEPVTSAHGTMLLRLKDATARFDFASSWREVGDDLDVNGEIAVDRVLWSDRGLPMHEHPTFLEDPPRKYLPEENIQIPPGEVEVLELRGSYQRVRVKTPTPNVLLIRDTHWRGWRYRILPDDSWRKVGRAMMLYRYIPVPAGEHVIEMRYLPPRWKTGLTISLISLLLLVAAATSGWWWRRKY